MADVLRSDWEQELARNGLSAVQPREGVAVEGSVSCPACGHTAPLDQGACGDCGLALG